MAKKADGESNPDMARREAEPTPNERLRGEQIFQEQQHVVRQLQNDPHLLEQRRILEQLKDDPRIRLRALIDPVPVSRPLNKRGPKRKLTDAEITRGIAVVRDVHAEFQRRHPGRKMKQDIAFERLGRELTRDGQPIVLDQKTLRRWIVGPALKPK